MDVTYSQPIQSFKSLLETAHLLRSPRNAERLLQALIRYQAGKGLASVARLS